MHLSTSRVLRGAYRIERINVDAGPEKRRVAKKFCATEKGPQSVRVYGALGHAPWLASIERDRLRSLMRAVIDHLERSRQPEDSLEPADPIGLGSKVCIQ
ncbi:hypothetical protein MAFF211491_04940 [Ralstonia solanacearum]|nr:hypothetical protein MAFF211491_04940 [Ralstonia solanacearum]BCM11356.1 hypothetical protein MAFF241648_05460 [Ralstonia solanacearum]